MSQFPPPPAPPQPRKRRTGLVVGLTLGAVVLVLLLCLGVGSAILSGIGDSAGQPASAAKHAATTASSEPSAGGAATDEATPPGPVQLTIGDSADLSQSDMDDSSATITVKSLRYQTGPANEYSEGPARGLFVIFTVQVASTGGSFDFNPDDFYVRAADGSRTNMGDGHAFGATGDTDILSYTTVNAGEHVQGPIAYDVKSRHGVLVYDPNLDGGPLAEWSF